MALPLALQDRLRSLDLGRLRFDEPMSKHTSFRIGGPADAYVELRNLEALARLQAFCRGEGLPLVFVGGGCNLLVRDGGIRGVVARLGREFRRLFLLAEGEERVASESQDEVDADAITRFSASLAAAAAGEGFSAGAGPQDDPAAARGPSAVLADSDGRVRLHVDAGVAVPALLKLCVRRGLSGVEGLAGVPGTVGGSLVMNAGTHEGELCNVVEVLQLMDTEGQFFSVPHDELEFEYRRLKVPRAGLIVSADLALEPAPPVRIQQAIQDLVAYRKSTQPVRTPSAGCVFKNPKDAPPAGKLIDDAGLKGTRVGGAVVSDVHANYVLNDDRATARDVLDLMAAVRKRIAVRWGVQLEDEVRILGEDPIDAQILADRT